MPTIDFVATNKNAERFREDASFVYRCENLALGLEAIGTQAALHHLRSYHPSADTQAVILHRPKFTPRLVWLIGRLRLAGIPVVADIDDLIVDPDFASASPAARNGALPLHKVVKQFKSQQRALRLVDLISVSTAPLAMHIERLFPGKPTLLLHNCVHATWRSEPETSWVKGSPRVILYMPGTKSHDRDFQQVVPVLAKFLGAHPEVTLDITGHLSAERTRELERSLAKYNTAAVAQIRHSPKVPFKDFAERFQGGWLNLSPLETSAFNDCKSALKIIEAGFWNIPTLSSPNPDADRFANDGAIIADGEDAWLRALERLLDDATYEQRTTDLRARTLELADIEENAALLLEALAPLRFTELLSGILPAAGKWQSPQLNLLRAKRHRRDGRYDRATLKLYEEAWLQGPTPQRLLAYLGFRRDLGHRINENEAQQLAATLGNFFGSEEHKAANLLLEVGETEKVHASIRPAHFIALATSSPAVAHSLGQPVAEAARHLARFCKDQAEWRDELASTLLSTTGSICVVGNAANLIGAGLGAKIDAHEAIVRFNHYCSETSQTADIGEQTDVWVRAPDLGDSKPQSRHPHWIVLSGADPIYQLRDWSSIVPLLRNGAQVVTVPLEIWRQLVDELKAPPSAGVLWMAWAIQILGDPSAVTAAGFQVREPARKDQQYHHALPRHKGSTRHHWPAERALLRRWQTQGLRILGA